MKSLKTLLVLVTMLVSAIVPVKAWSPLDNAITGKVTLVSYDSKQGESEFLISTNDPNILIGADKHWMAGLKTAGGQSFTSDAKIMLVDDNTARIYFEVSADLAGKECDFYVGFTNNYQSMPQYYLTTTDKKITIDSDNVSSITDHLLYSSNEKGITLSFDSTADAKGVDEYFRSLESVWIIPVNSTLSIMALKDNPARGGSDFTYITADEKVTSVVIGAETLAYYGLPKGMTVNCNTSSTFCYKSTSTSMPLTLEAGAKELTDITISAYQSAEEPYDIIIETNSKDYADHTGRVCLADAPNTSLMINLNGGDPNILNFEEKNEGVYQAKISYQYFAMYLDATDDEGDGTVKYLNIFSDKYVQAQAAFNVKKSPKYYPIPEKFAIILTKDAIVLRSPDRDVLDKIMKDASEGNPAVLYINCFDNDMELETELLLTKELLTDGVKTDDTLSGFYSMKVDYLQDVELVNELKEWTGAYPNINLNVEGYENFANYSHRYDFLGYLKLNAELQDLYAGEFDSFKDLVSILSATDSIVTNEKEQSVKTVSNIDVKESEMSDTSGIDVRLYGAVTAALEADNDLNRSHGETVQVTMSAKELDAAHVEAIIGETSSKEKLEPVASVDIVISKSVDGADKEMIEMPYDVAFSFVLPTDFDEEADYRIISEHTDEKGVTEVYELSGDDLLIDAENNLAYVLSNKFSSFVMVKTVADTKPNKPVNTTTPHKVVNTAVY